MEKQYTDKDINNFYVKFKEISSSYPVSKILDILDKNPSPHLPSQNLRYTLKGPVISAIILITCTIIYFSLNQEQEQTIPVARENNMGDNPGVINEKPTSQLKEATSPVVLKEDNVKQDDPDVKKIENSDESKDIPVRVEVERQALKVMKTNVQEKDMRKELCEWPEDTILDGESFILNLTDTQMINLGFLINSTGIYYANEFNGKRTYFHSRWENKSGEMTMITDFKNRRNKKLEVSHFDFHPVFVTDFLYNPAFTNSKDFEDFHYKNDTLIPVLIRSELCPLYDYDFLIWFLPTKEFFKQLPQQYQEHSSAYNCVRELKLNGIQRDVVKYEKKSLIEGANLIRPDEKSIGKLGLRIQNDNSIVYNETNEICNFSIRIDSMSISVHVNPNQELKPNSDIRLIFISNKSGRQSIKWNCNDEDIRTLYETFDLLIPILISKDDFPHHLYEDQIFWFQPTNDLFKALPRKIGQQIKEEYQSITSGNLTDDKETLSCTYFEVCKSTLYAREIMVFPNPVNSTLNLSFELIEKGEEGSIILLNTSGYKIKELKINEQFKVGINSFEFDLTDIPSGLYILKVASKDGYFTRRVIVEK